MKRGPINPVRDAKMAAAFDAGNFVKAKRIFEGRDYQKDDKLVWRADHPEREDLAGAFGPGPFTVLGAADGAPEGGLWLSLLNEQGKAFIRGEWREYTPGPPYQAVPPTFHSDWFDRA